MLNPQRFTLYVYLSQLKIANGQKLKFDQGSNGFLSIKNKTVHVPAVKASGSLDEGMQASCCRDPAVHMCGSRQIGVRERLLL